MAHSHTDMVRHTRALLLRANHSIDAGTVDEFLTSRPFAEAVASYNMILLSRFKAFTGHRSATLADADAQARKNTPRRPPAPAVPAPTVTKFDFEKFPSVPQPMTPSVTSSLPAPALPAGPGAAEKPVEVGTAAAAVEGAGPAASAATPSAVAAMPAHAVAPARKLPNLVFWVGNLRQGECCTQKLQLQSGELDDLLILEAQVPPNLDLRIDLLDGVLSGTPAQAGEFEIALAWCYKSEGQAFKRKAVLPVLVNADPKSLWKDLPSDRSDIFWKEDAVCSAVTGAQFRMIAASKRGRSHAHVGSFRDDDYFIGHSTQTGWYTAVLADGAGSAKLSRQGARLVCDAASTYLSAALLGNTGAAIDAAVTAYDAARKRGDPLGVIEQASQALRKSLYGAVGHAAFHCVKAIADAAASFKDQPANYKDFSSTALISITRRYPFGTLCAAYWVGDGAIGIYSKNGGITLLGNVDSGEFSGQTRFLDAGEVTAEALLRRTRFELVDEMTALILMTDGVSDPKFDTEANLERPAAWHTLWQDIDQAVDLQARAEGAERRLLSWLDFWSQGNHDDRTIAIVY